MRFSCTTRRMGAALLVAGLLSGPAVALTGCGGGGGSSLPSGRPTGARSAARPAESTAASPPSRGSREPARGSTGPAAPATTRAPEVTGPPATTAPARPASPQGARPASPAAPATSPAVAPPAAEEAVPPATTPAPATSMTPAADSGGPGPLGWILVIGIIGAVAAIAVILIRRSRHTTDWDAEAADLAADTRTATGTQLPPVLTAETAGARGLSWPPLRARLYELADGWNGLATRTSDDQRRSRSLRIRDLLTDLILAVDAENEALSTGRDWRMLRPQVEEIRRTLAAALADQPLVTPAPDDGPATRPPAPDDGPATRPPATRPPTRPSVPPEEPRPEPPTRET